MDAAEDLSLYHVGVKGMRWGRRKPDNSGSAPVRTRRATRAEKRAHFQAYADKKTETLIKTALKDGDTLISLRHNPNLAPSVVTGKEFIDFLKRGGQMDIRATDIYAKKGSGGKYELQNRDQYQKLKRVPA